MFGYGIEFGLAGVGAEDDEVGFGGGLSNDATVC